MSIQEKHPLNSLLPLDKQRYFSVFAYFFPLFHCETKNNTRTRIIIFILYHRYVYLQQLTDCLRCVTFAWRRQERKKLKNTFHEIELNELQVYEKRERKKNV